jgi:hypothetical protein
VPRDYELTVSVRPFWLNQAPWDRYIGKRKCYTCGLPVLMCDRCCSANPHKSTDEATRLTVRCQICKDDNVTAPAAEVELTHNGITVAQVGPAVE